MRNTSAPGFDGDLSAELDRARKREAATREILEVISRSREDERPVFDAILHRAADLCNATAAALTTGREGDTHQSLVAHYGVSPSTVEIYDRGKVPMDPAISLAAQAILTGESIHIPDMMDTEGYRRGVASYVSVVRDTGVRTELYVPLVTPAGGIGSLILFRTEVRPFTADEIVIVETFAAQAVIAIENVRQFRELQTRLAREAATREILEVISQSREDDRPVFNVVLRKAAELCGASMAGLNIISEDRSHAVMVAEWGDHVADLRPVGETAWPIESDHAPSTCIREGRIVHVHDLADTDLYRSGDPIRVTAVDREGIRTFLAVPLFSGGKTESCISIYRREVRPFTADEIALVETFAAQAVIAIENTSQFRAIQMANSELQTRLAREAATREILEVISQSREDDHPVFDVVLRKAAELCGAKLASLWLISEDRSQAAIVANGGEMDRYFTAGATAWSMGALNGPTTCMREGRIVHIHDMADTDLYRSGDQIRTVAVDKEQIHTYLAVPLFSGDQTIGCIETYRREVRPFTADEIALVETFAAQAVIAIENVRQFRELQARLEREKASAEILEIISQSRDDEVPVFDMILRKSTELCGAFAAAIIMGSEGDTHQRILASHAVSPATLAIYDSGVVSMDPDISITARAIVTGKVIHVEDMRDTDGYRSGNAHFRSVVEDSGIRTNLFVPLISSGKGIGALTLFRKEVRSYTSDEIALVETFAAQAVIAIENVRQFRELQARLAREAATREILEAISQSRDDDTPVFDLIARSAARLCGAAICTFWRVEDGMIHYGASHGLDGASSEETRSTLPMPLLGTTLTGQVFKSRAVVRIEDGTAESYHDHDWAREQGLKQFIGVPIFVRDDVWGSINLMWPADMVPQDTDIQLVEGFAAQASIAIENVRQFRELQARLAREAAMREILEVISQSRDDDAPVFEMVLRKAAELCHASLASLFTSEHSKRLVLAAEWGEHVADALPAGITEWSMVSPAAVSTCIREGRVVHIHDLADTDLYRSGDPIRVHVVDAEGMRTLLAVPLFRGGKTDSCILIYRREVRPFTSDEIALVETFAAQASIAIENVRQFRELQARLAREAATREILTVISQSRDDDRPVFDVVLRKAAELCGASLADLEIISADGSHSVMVAHWGETLRHHVVGETAWPMESELATAIYNPEGRIVHVHDMADTDPYRAGDPMRVADVDKEGIRTFLAVPLFSDGKTVGCIVLYRREVKPFTPDEIALVQTFAAQAVIAIDNVRQFRELQTRLAREAATREILEVISQSRDDVRPVYEAIMSNATRLCGASTAAVLLGRPDDPHVIMVAYQPPDAQSQEYIDAIVAENNEPPMRMNPAEHIAAQAICSGQVVHIADLAQTESYRSGVPTFKLMVDDIGLRTILSVPLFDARGTIGALNLLRQEVRLFDQGEIALVETFAAQAVIAIDNVRQFRELQTRLEREKASAEILEVISRSRDDEVPVFAVILQNVARLCSTSLATLDRVNEAGTHLEYAAHWGIGLKSFDLGNDRWPLDSSLQIAQAVREGRVIHTPDLADTDLYRRGDPIRVRLVDEEGVQSYLTVPLITAARRTIGCLCLYRQELRPFTPDEIALVETFAAQAVIAIENVRQFKALEALNAELGDRVQDQVGEIERMGRLKRFLPAAVADAVVSSGSEKMLSSHRALLGVLFADIRGFTSFCETAEPEETIEVLQTYHEEMGRLINDHGAGVDHRMGDGIMVLFNDPLPCDDPAGDAVRLAMAMRARMADLCVKWKRSGYRLGFGLGVSLGYATVGMVGAGGRHDYTASGTAINLASRLCDEAQDGEILISPRARTAIEDDFTVESRGEISFKGIREPVEVFCVTGVVGEGITPRSAGPP